MKFRIKKIKKISKKITKNPLRLIIGGFFIFLGLIGALLPIMQGWFFFIIGIAILLEKNIKEGIQELKEKISVKKYLKKN
ncbi:MAG: hypothetical protein ACOC1P_01400 [Minisyncoccales bacterium]